MTSTTLKMVDWQCFRVMLLIPTSPRGEGKAGAENASRSYLFYIVFGSENSFPKMTYIKGNTLIKFASTSISSPRRYKYISTSISSQLFSVQPLSVSLSNSVCNLFLFNAATQLLFVEKLSNIIFWFSTSHFVALFRLTQLLLDTSSSPSGTPVGIGLDEDTALVVDNDRNAEVKLMIGTFNSGSEKKFISVCWNEFLINILIIYLHRHGCVSTAPVV